MKKINKWVMISIVLGILLLSSLVYIGVKSYKEARASKEYDIFLQGAQYGYQSAVTELMKAGTNCSPVNIYVQNETMQFIDVSCISGANK